MLECTTHPLEQKEEWTWNYQHDYSHQCVRMQLTRYNCKSRINEYGIINMITVTNMPECITYPLWLSEQGEGWAWCHQHDHTYQHARMYDSHAMIARAGWTMDIESSAWSVTNRPEGTTHMLWLAKHDEDEIISVITITNTYTKMHSLTMIPKGSTIRTCPMWHKTWIVNTLLP